MGAVTDRARARPPGAAGAELRSGAEVTAIDPTARRRRCAAPTAAATASGAGHVLANVAPAVLDRLLASRAPSAAPPEGAQLKVNMLLARLPRLRDGGVDPREAFAGTFHVNEGYASSSAPTREAAGRRACPSVVAVRDLLPLAHRPEHPRARAAGRGRADADAASGCTCRRGCSPADHDGARERGARGHARARSTACSPSRSRDCLLARRRRPAVHRGEDAARPRGASSACRAATSSTATCSGRSPRARGEVGTLGRRDRRTPRVLLCGAGARRGGGGQRHPRPQRRDGRAAA